MDHPATLAATVIAVLILLDVAALRWGVDSRDGPQSTERFPLMIDPFTAEHLSRHRQAHVLAEVERDRLLAQARRAVPAAAPRRLPVPPLAFRAPLRAILARAGALLVAAGIRLQRLAGAPEAPTLEPSW